MWKLQLGNISSIGVIPSEFEGENLVKLNILQKFTMRKTNLISREMDIDKRFDSMLKNIPSVLALLNCLLID